VADPGSRSKYGPLGIQSSHRRGSFGAAAGGAFRTVGGRKPPHAAPNARIQRVREQTAAEARGMSHPVLEIVLDHAGKPPVRRKQVKLSIALVASEPQNPEDNAQHSERCSDLEVGLKSDFKAARAGPLRHDEIGHRTDESEVAGERRGHGDHKPGARRIGERGDERLHHEYGRHVAHQVR